MPWRRLIETCFITLLVITSGDSSELGFTLDNFGFLFDNQADSQERGAGTSLRKSLTISGRIFELSVEFKSQYLLILISTRWQQQKMWIDEWLSTNWCFLRFQNGFCYLETKSRYHCTVISFIQKDFTLIGHFLGSAFQVFLFNFYFIR